MAIAIEGWTKTTTTVETVDVKGQELVLEGVTAYKGPKPNDLFLFPEDVMRAELEALAKVLCLESRDIALFAMIQAKPGPFQEGYTHTLYRLNKMLFYQWKGLERRGFGEALPHDEFEAKEKGPVPKRLKEDLHRLEKMGYLQVSWPSGPERGSVSVTLTAKGAMVGSVVVQKLDPVLWEETLRWKRRLFLKRPREIMKQVHKDYPEYRATYTEPDTG